MSSYRFVGHYKVEFDAKSDEAAMKFGAILDWRLGQLIDDLAELVYSEMELVEIPQRPKRRKLWIVGDPVEAILMPEPIREVGFDPEIVEAVNRRESRRRGRPRPAAARTRGERKLSYPVIR